MMELFDGRAFGQTIRVICFAPLVCYAVYGQADASWAWLMSMVLGLVSLVRSSCWASLHADSQDYARHGRLPTFRACPTRGLVYALGCHASACVWPTGSRCCTFYRHASKACLHDYCRVP